jgi:hypothetical protein
LDDRARAIEFAPSGNYLRAHRIPLQICLQSCDEGLLGGRLAARRSSAGWTRRFDQAWTSAVRPTRRLSPVGPTGPRHSREPTFC